MVDSYAYVADGDLRIINVADPAGPSEVGFYDTPGVARDVVVAGHYAYIADGESGLRILDVADPAAPVEVGTYKTLGEPRAVTVVESYVYVAAGSGGVFVLGFRLIPVSVVIPTAGHLISARDQTTYSFDATVTHMPRYHHGEAGALRAVGRVGGDAADVPATGCGAPLSGKGSPSGYPEPGGRPKMSQG